MVPSPSSALALLRRLALPGLVAVSAGSALAGPRAWQPLDRLTDVPHATARDLAPVVRSAGEAGVDLPWAVNLGGRPSRRVVVGPGWLRLVGTPQPAADVAGQRSLPAGEIDLAATRTLDVLPAGLAELGSVSRILVTVEDDGLAVRWVGVAVPGGLATAEALVDRTGRITVQYLHVPPSIEGLRAGFADAPLSPRNATALRLVLNDPIQLAPPSHPRLPAHSDPPPAGCNPETGTWCERADGPGTSEVWLSESFDDLNALARGWIMTSKWHSVPFTTCPPGATSDPGGSAYFGEDGSCLYLPNVFGSLVSPPIGPVTTGSQFIWSSRFAYEGGGFDFAQIYVNGTLIGDMPTGLDPTLWYNFNPIDLSPWAGTMVQIEFFFQSDGSNEDLGWFIDDVIAWNPNVGEPDCIKMAGHGQFAACDDRQATSWTFSEGAFCQGCTYSFYVLVECGREMHVPLDDMEGADIRITNVVDPLAPPPLRCVNTTARADAGTGAYRGTNLPSELGGLLDCCAAPPGAEVFWGPPFDVTDGAGPGHVAWGLADGCPSVLVYDPDVPPDGLFDCADLGGSCGLLDRLSPGENQVMDCYIEDATGLCGLYRVDVISGGNVWTLFANCDGTNTPQFPIFFDCTEAWTAYNPLPELTVSNLVVSGGCPDLTVDFDISNLGCAEHPGDAVARIEASGADASCGLPPNVLDAVVTGPFPPGSTTHVTRTITAPCAPARVDVTADPLNDVAECTETPGAAACRRDGGIDTISSFTCGCTAQLDADAGADIGGCVGRTVRLDASASTVTACATRTMYRWLDDTGAIVRDWNPSPTHDVFVRCPAGRTYTLELACDGEPCSDSDTITVSCIAIAADAGPDAKACVGDSVVLDASASTVSNCAQPVYRWFDGVGNEVRGWTTDPTFTIASLACDVAGDWMVEVGCQGEACTSFEFATVECVEVLADAGPDLAGCEGIPVDITRARSTSTGCSSVVYQWFDPLGNPVSGVLTDPDVSVTLTGCPNVGTLVLVAACADPGFETCGTFDTMDIDCGNPAVPAPVATPTCTGAGVACGAAEPGVAYWWDADTAADADGDTVPENDHDLDACDGSLGYPDAATRTARAWAEDAIGCLSFADVPVTPLAAPAAPVPSADPACAGVARLMHCGSAEPGVSWDLDVAADSDGNTVPDDDADAATCDASATYPAGSFTAKVTVTSAGGCSSSATILVDVADPVAPPEVGDDRVTRAGASLTIGWTATPGASTYRVSRGTIGTWYDHAADAGRGSCDTAGATTFTDADEATDGNNWYYLITAVEPCGAEGPAGTGDTGIARPERPARLPTAGCP